MALSILHWGTGDKGKPRNRILLTALKSAGATVSEIHVDVWKEVEDKSQLGAIERLFRYLKWVAVYPALIFRFLSGPKPDAVLLTYPALLDALVLWPAARVRGVPVLMDLFLSIYDTTVSDRASLRPTSMRARAIWILEWLACRSVDKLIVDTGPHARYIEEIFHLPVGSVGHVPVGVEQDQFHPLGAPSARSRPVILFYGQLIPLHGIETVIEAALSDRGKAFDWVIIGSGQDSPKLETAFGSGSPNHITWIKWVDYSELRGWIEGADICLGIFGGSRKAACVVPNKLFQSLACGRHVVTRASPAMSEFCPKAEPGITLVEPASSEALLDGIESSVRTGCTPPSAAIIDSFSSDEIGARLADYYQSLLARRN